MLKGMEGKRKSIMHTNDEVLLKLAINSCYSMCLTLFECGYSAIQFLISWTLAALNSFTASAKLFHVDGGLSIFNHSESISRKQSYPCLSLCFISRRILSLIPRRTPILFQSAARGNSFSNASFSFGLSPGWQKDYFIWIIVA